MSSITVSASGTYDVTVTDTLGCVGASAPEAVTAVTVVVPIITQIDDTLYSSEPTGNQWFFEGTPIPGATSSIYAPDTTGNFTVEYTDTNGCSASSDTTFFDLTQIGVGAGLSDEVGVYPNPYHEEFTFEGNFGTPGTLKLVLF